MPEDTQAQGRLSVYLQPSAAKKLKLLGVEREKPVNTLVLEALAFWWKHQTDVKGSLFSEENTEKTATPEKKEPATKKTSPLAKAQKKGPKKSSSSR